MLALPENMEEYRLSYNGSIRIAPALGTQNRHPGKAVPSRTPFGQSKTIPWGSGPLQRTVDLRPRFENGVGERHQGLGGIAAVAQRRFQPFGGFRDAERAPIRRAEPFSLCVSSAASAGICGDLLDQLARLGREHRQNFTFQAAIAHRHTLKVGEIDRSVIGNQRR